MNQSFSVARNRRSAFTLIEILVVVAIIALLISILLPALSRARAQAKMVMCEAHLKELGNALQMYMIDSKERMPGPLHPAMLKNTRNVPPAYSIQKTFYLPAMLRKYFSEAYKGQASMADAISTCPAYPVADDKFASVWGTGPNPFNYCMNTWTNTCAGCNPTGIPDVSKNLDYYFGFTHAGVTDYTDWYNTYGNTPTRLETFSPKRLSRIKFPTKEWAIADAFRRPYTWEPAPAATLNAALPRGTWPREDPAFNASNSGNNIATSPFHLDSGYISNGAGQIYRGRTNTLYFDSHVESMRGFSRFLYNRDEK